MMKDVIILREALPGTQLIVGPQSAFDARPWPGEEALPLQSRAARGAARQLLALPTAIPRSATGAPLAPAGCALSLSHSAQHCAAALTQSALGIGVDLEPEQPLPAEAAAYALTASERGRLAQAPAWAPLAAFCAKESLHKALHPLTGIFLEFDEVEIHFDSACQYFTAVPRSAAAVQALAALTSQGRILQVGGNLLALLELR